MENLVVVCADIGAVEQNFAWWSSNGASGSKPSSLAKLVISLLEDDKGVALGFECPLFVPLPVEENALGKKRGGEGTRAWSAGAGAAVLATGLVQVTWVLREIRLGLSSSSKAYLSWEEFLKRRKGLFLWEAFVSDKAKKRSHLEDAEAGARAFMAHASGTGQVQYLHCEEEVFSLIGAALLRAGWELQVEALAKPCLALGPLPE